MSNAVTTQAPELLNYVNGAWRRSAATVNGGDVHPGVIGDHKTVGIGGIDPDIVSVSAPADFLEILPSIKRLVKRAVGNVNFVVASLRYCDSDASADQLIAAYITDIEILHSRGLRAIQNRLLRRPDGC
jgi:hypothetical protein